MSLYLLDTDTASLFQSGHAKVCAAAANHSPPDVAITVLTVEEQLSGWYKELRRAKKPPLLASVYDRMARTTQFLGRLQILSFSVAAIHRWEKLKRLKLNIGKTDLRIAAIALEQSA